MKYQEKGKELEGELWRDRNFGQHSELQVDSKREEQYEEFNSQGLGGFLFSNPVFDYDCFIF